MYYLLMFIISLLLFLAAGLVVELVSGRWKKKRPPAP